MNGVFWPRPPAMQSLSAELGQHTVFKGKRGAGGGLSGDLQGSSHSPRNLLFVAARIYIHNERRVRRVCKFIACDTPGSPGSRPLTDRAFSYRYVRVKRQNQTYFVPVAMVRPLSTTICSSSAPFSSYYARHLVHSPTRLVTSSPRYPRRSTTPSLRIR